LSSIPAIELKGLTKIYQEGERQITVLRDVDLRVEPGEILVLLGRSGSGKSTLLNLLAGIDLPTTGRVLFDGVDITRLDEHRRTVLRRHRIGFVFQFFNLIPTLTVEENLHLPLELAGRLDAQNRDYARHLLERVALVDRRTSFPDVLSGGEQQRIAIARALVHNPALVLADEPTGNLDADTAEKVLDLLVGTLRQSGKTLVMATHSREVASLADRVLQVQDGTLVEA
jgi:putative ABC transport system ATP-binding protein